MLTHPQGNDMTTNSSSKRGVNLSIGPLVAVILMMVLIAMMGLLSLTHLNAMSTKGYEINKLESEHQDLVQDGEINDMLILQARSMKTIEGHQLVQNMVKPQDVYYLESVSGFASAN